MVAPMLATYYMSWWEYMWHVNHVLLYCNQIDLPNKRSSYSSLITVDGWLQSLDFDGFADLMFKPAFLYGQHFHIVLADDMTLILTMVPRCWLSVVAGVGFLSFCQGWTLLRIYVLAQSFYPLHHKLSKHYIWVACSLRVLIYKIHYTCELCNQLLLKHKLQLPPSTS